MAGPEGVREAAALAHCAELVKKSAKNFWFAFRFLPKERRAAMYAVYAFCREADDIVDEGGALEEKRARLDAFRAGLDAAFAGEPEGPIFVALASTARRFGLSKKHLADVIDGCAMDLTTARYETWDDLCRYLDRVASAVGRTTMEICEVDPARWTDYAFAGGYSVQMTNILRDVKEDADRGRIYLPMEDLRRFGVAPEDLGETAPTPAFRELMRFEVERTRALYAKARASIGDAERRRLLPLEAIVRIYSRLLDAIEARGYDVLSARVAVSGWKKLSLGLGTWARTKLGLPLGS